MEGGALISSYSRDGNWKEDGSKMEVTTVLSLASKIMQ